MVVVKTARFTDLVKQAGAPEAYLLWVPPKKDRVFQRALKEHRVLTVHQENVGAKKDHGRVGFFEEAHAQYLVFPKSVGAFEGRRVIGINYGLLAEESRPGAAPKIEPRKVGAKPGKLAKRETAASERESTLAETRSAKTKGQAKSRTEPVTEAEDEKIVAFEAKESKRSQRVKAEKKPVEELTRSQKPVKKEVGGASIDAKVLRVIRQAMKDLDAGKAVAAYKRLEALVEAGANE